MKMYMITLSTDAYTASRSVRHLQHKVLRYNGITPVEWIHDDNYEDGYTLEEARQILDSCYREDVDESGREGFEHRHFDMSYRSGAYTYTIEEMTEEE